MRTVVVTGSTGFIGTWLVKELLEHGYNVIALVRQQSGALNDSIDNIRYIQYDSVEYNRLFLEKNTIDAFYHLAWGGVSSNQKNDCILQMENIQFSLKMLEFAQELHVKKFIATGTVAEYSFCESIMDVHARQTPNDMYGASKTATHYMLETRARMLHLPFVWAVIPSTFGEGRRDNNIITYTILSLLKGQYPKYGDLTQMWDFLYVKEVVTALRLIEEKGNTETTYGIGSGVFKPLKDYITLIRDIIAPQAELGIGEIPSYSDKAFSSCVSIYDLTKDTGFVPRIGFTEGIKRTIPYYVDKVRKEKNV